ncbi:MAG TPA: MBL fold metallo-hydrolase [Myxococcota bacterium]|nr:MBL fold metallo-hydrolase [Myxococcota bacterium]
MKNKLYFRQLLAGRDFAKNNPAAKQMENFVYLIGDKEKGECVVVDPAWDIAGILQIAEHDGMKIIGALATHYHPDHVGGKIFGFSIEGLAELIAVNPCKIHAHRLEKDGIIKVTGLSPSDIVAHESNDIVKAGDIEIELLHTPGHTPGSLCFRVKNALVSGDTLFLQGCGRVDLPGGDVEEMYRTIQQRLNTIDDNTVVYPGHAYGGEHDNMAAIRQSNPVFSYLDLASFKRLFR